MINRLRSYGALPLMMSLNILLMYAVFQTIETLQVAWLVLVFSQAPVTAMFLYQFLNKSGEKDQGYKISTMLVLFSVLYSSFSLFQNYSPANLHVFAIALSYFVIFLLFAYWQPLLPRKRGDASISVGSTFPNFVLDNEFGDPVSSQQILAQPSLFLFIRGNWCALCMAQIKEVATSYQKISDLGVRVIIVSSQPLEKTKKLAQRFAVEFSYLVDKNFELADKLAIRHENGTIKGLGIGYQADTILPTVVFTNDKGRVVYLDETDNNRLRPEPEEFIKIIKQYKLQNFLEEKIDSRTRELQEEQKKFQNLLFNILPSHTAQELLERGKTIPRQYKNATILFTDFKDFSKIAVNLNPGQLIQELNEYFSAFDEIISRHNLERIKTIGDAYMAAGGLPKKNFTNPIDAVLAALEMQQTVALFNQKRLSQGKPFFELRIGIHTGEVVAGVVGNKRFAFDIWGDAVNLASRMESNGEAARVNVSEDTYALVKYFFESSRRGDVEVKNRGQVVMHFIDGLKRKYSKDGSLFTPNAEMRSIYERIASGAKVVESSAGQTVS